MASESGPKLSPFDAFLSALMFLQFRNNRRPSVDLAATALAMVPPPDGGPPPDPTTWDDWVRAVQTVLSSGGNIPIRLELQPKEGQAGSCIQHDGGEFHPHRVVCVTVVPSFDKTEYTLDATVEAKLLKLVEGLGPNCRVSKFQWLAVTDERCGAIAQDLEHEGVENVLVFSVLIGTDWLFRCKPKGKADEWEFDGVGAFLQQQLG